MVGPTPDRYGIGRRQSAVPSEENLPVRYCLDRPFRPPDAAQAGGLDLMIKAGFMPGSPAKVVLVIAAVLIQGILPFPRARRHRQDIAPPDHPLRDPLRHHVGLRHSARQPARRQDEWGLAGITEALAFTIALSGLGWTECGNDYTATAPLTRRRRALWAGSSSGRPCRKSSS